MILACAILLAPRLALAQRVLLVRLPEPDAVLSEAFNRLRAELTVEGFEVEVVEPEVKPGAASDAKADGNVLSPEALAELATRAGALAGISLTRHADAAAAQLCIADRVTGKISMRTVELRPGPDAPSVLAVRATDLLRSSLGELKPGERPPPDVVGVEPKPAPEAVQRFVRAPSPRFRIDAGAAVVGLGSRTGLAFAPSLALGVRVADRVGLELAFAGPALGATYDTADGTSIVTQEIGLARAWVTLVRRGPFEAQALAMAGVVHLDAHGDVAPPLASKSEAVTSFAGGAGLAVEGRVAPRIVVRIEGAALGLAPRPAVALLENQYAFPEPYVTAAAGLGVDF